MEDYYTTQRSRKKVDEYRDFPVHMREVRSQPIEISSIEIHFKKLSHMFSYPRNQGIPLAHLCRSLNAAL